MGTSDGSNDDESRSPSVVGDNEFVGFEMSDAEESDNEMVDVDELEKELDPSLLTFRGHHDEVLCCDIHPMKANVVATGAMDNKTFVWEFANNEINVIKEITLFESVDFVKFNPDGRYLAAGDLAGHIGFYDTTNWESRFVKDLEDSNGPVSIMWHPVAPVLIAVLQTHAVMINVASEETKIVAWSTNGSFISGKMFPDGKRIAVISDQAIISVVDLKAASVVATGSTKQPNSSLGNIVCLDIHRDGTVVLCGCDNGLFSFTTKTSTLAIKQVLFPTDSDEVMYVEQVAYATTEAFKNLAASNHLHTIRFWDTTKQSLRCMSVIEINVTQMVWHPTEPTLFASLSSGDTLAIDGRTGNLLKNFHCHKSAIFGLALSPDARHFVTCSQDHNATVCQTNYEETIEMEL